ncbi:MAG: hypothetical protein WCK89_07025 [bacterium]
MNSKTNPPGSRSRCPDTIPKPFFLVFMFLSVTSAIYGMDGHSENRTSGRQKEEPVIAWSPLTIEAAATNQFSYSRMTNSLALMEKIIEVRCALFVITRNNPSEADRKILNTIGLSQEGLQREVKNLFRSLERETNEEDELLVAEYNMVKTQLENVHSSGHRPYMTIIERMSESKRLELFVCVAHYRAILLREFEAECRNRIVK